MSENQTINTIPLCVGIGYTEVDHESLKLFFRQLKTSIPLCFLLVKQDHQKHHEAPNTLACGTPFQICQAKDQMPLKPHTIYCIPEGLYASIYQGKILLTPYIYHHTLRQPIVDLFQALAASFGEKATGIVFSGCGIEGKQALKVISASHGMVFLQIAGHFNQYDPCKKDTIRLEVHQIAQYLMAQLEIPEQKISLEKIDMQRWFPEIRRLLLQKTGIDYSGYKSNTLERKTVHRMRITHCASAQDYFRLLQTHDDEIKLLSSDFRISVTQFFRNPEVFTYIRNHIISTLVNGHNEPIHIWIAACSSGEEAYSLAMLWDDYVQNISPKPQVRIWASDIDISLLQQARKGVYPAASIVRCIPPQYLKTCFIPHGDQYLVKPHIQKMIEFVRHNLVTDPPLAGMHLISCRNMLIYLSPQTQSLVIEKLTATLRENGYLILGKKETPGKLSTLLEELNPQLRIFQKKKNLQKNHRSFPKNTSHAL